ncbi:PREDICTED: protein WVD2-like 7 isoform X2 [Prunus mume]|uniref:Protein WVD2-like 7 isoform X2 n=1 Tax=Prunus mume TaxID=102107 RepID=A0ABM0N9K0_PRUMU|nr:PREDICTED: protein WVD2-like 7 isoform X2 [Prunus mume]
MGESIVDFANDADEVGEAAASNSSNPALEVSVSFGRFENDSLSWEKWSTFSPNKYLEEVEKCATPGSVAQKRAYFEAHYKKIAARKAQELLEQEKQMQDDPFRSDDQKGGDQIDCGTHFEIDLTNSQSTTQANYQETNFDNQTISTHVDDLKEDDVITIECQSSLTEGEKETTDSFTASPNLNNPEELILEKEAENVPAESEGIQEIPRSLDNEMGKAPEVKEEKEKKPRLLLRKGSQKVTTGVSKERNVANVKKKPIPQITKTPQKSTPRVSKPISTSTLRVSKPISTSTPRLSKPISTSTARVSKPISTSTPRASKSISTSIATPAPRSSVKMGNTSSLPRSKNPSIEDTKKVPPKSLHMSLSLDPAKSDSASPTTARKSFIMENMGDKDIVRRAFKTFQNNYNQPKSSSEEKSSTPTQLSTKGKESRVSTSVLLPKENGGSLGKGTPKAAPSSFGLRNDERVDKRKEAKSNPKEAERLHYQPKSKGQNEAEIKKLRHSLNFKTTPMPGSYRREKMSKSTSEKESSKNETHR